MKYYHIIAGGLWLRCPRAGGEGARVRASGACVEAGGPGHCWSVLRRFRDQRGWGGCCCGGWFWGCGGGAWSRLGGPLLCAAAAVCGLSGSRRWRPETWWWNDRVEDVVKEKRIRYKAYNALKKVGKVVEAREAGTAYNEARRVAGRVVWLAGSEDGGEVFADVSPAGGGVFRLAGRVDRAGRGVVGDGCIRGDAGGLSLGGGDGVGAWVERCAGLLGVEFG